MVGIIGIRLMYLPKDVEGQIPVSPYDLMHLIYLSSNIHTMTILKTVAKVESKASLVT